MSKVQKDSAAAWIFLATAFFALSILYGVCISGGLLNAYLLDAFNESKSFTSVPFSLNSSIMMAAGIIVSPLINRYGCHVALALGSLLAACGMALSAFASGVMFLIFSYGILTGFGLACSFLAVLVVVGQLFDEYRTIAYGITATGIASGVIIFPPLVHYLSGLYSWRGCFMILSGLALNILLPALLILYHRPMEVSEKQAETVEKHKRSVVTLVGGSTLSMANIFGSTEILSTISLENIYKQKSSINASVKSLPNFCKTENSEHLLKSSIVNSRTRTQKSSAEKNESNSSHTYFHWNIFRIKALIVLSLAFFCRAWGKNSWNIHITAIGLHKVLSYDEAPNVLLVHGCVQVVARPAASLLGNCFSSKKLFIWSAAATVSGIWMVMGVLLTNSRVSFYLFIGLFGVVDGFLDSLWAPAILDVVGENSLSSALGVVGLIYGIGQATAPPLAGLMFDKFQSYDGTFYLGGTSYIAAGLLSCAAGTIQYISRRRKHQTAENMTSLT